MITEDLKSYLDFIAEYEKVILDLGERLKNFAAINKAVGQTYNNKSLIFLANWIPQATIVAITSKYVSIEWDEYWNYGGHEKHTLDVLISELFNPELVEARLLATEKFSLEKEKQQKAKEKKLEFEADLAEYQRLKKKFGGQ